MVNLEIGTRIRRMLCNADKTHLKDQRKSALPKASV